MKSKKFDSEIDIMREEIIHSILWRINRTPTYYNAFKHADNGSQVKYMVEQIMKLKKHNKGWFGDVMDVELDLLRKKDWERIYKSI